MTRERGQALTLEYVLGLSIALVLVVGLLTASAGFVDEQRKESTRAELRVVGQQVAADVEAADRLVAATESNATVRIDRDLPGEATGSPYSIELLVASNPSLRLSTETPNVTVRVSIANDTSVDGSTVPGGPVVINYTDDDSLRLERGDR